MKTKKNILYTNISEITDFLRSTDFSKAILMMLALLIPIVVSLQWDALGIGITISLGAMFASPNDVSGNVRMKLKGICLAILLCMFVISISGFIRSSYALLFPGLGVLIFFISYLSVYGFRSSLISFSGLFALALSFSSLAESAIPTYQRVLLIGAGGIWYMLLVVLRNVFFPKAPIEYSMLKTIRLTATYLYTRGLLADVKNDRAALLEELLRIQGELTDLHETLRELLMTGRRDSGKSSYGARRLLVFVHLVDMLELAMAHPVIYYKTDVVFKEKPELLTAFQNLLFAMSARLESIGDHISTPGRLERDQRMAEYLSEVEKGIAELLHTDVENKGEKFLMMNNVLKYQQNQTETIKKIEWLFRNPRKSDYNHVRKEDFKGFLTKENYDFNILVNNFNLESPIFRHSLRIAIVSIVGYAVGILFDLQNPYWIVLTVIVIMRPSYGLTNERFRHRSIGTLIGGVIAFALIMLIHNTTIYAILAVVSFVIGFSMVQRNYKASAIFITLQVLFTYALLEPDVFEVMQFRVLDTLIGAGLAALGNLLLWPAWEIKSIDKTLLETLCAIREYLRDIAAYYNDKTTYSNEYKISRKRAFLAISELSSSFQRMAQEPKSQQKDLHKIYELAMLHHTFLAALASLSAFILNNPTTPASENFNAVIKRILDILEAGEKTIENKDYTPSEAFFKEDVFKDTFGDHRSYIAMTEKNSGDEIAPELEEASLVLEQLQWMLGMSKKILKSLGQMEWDKA